MASDITDSHKQAVDAISSSVRKFYDRKEPFRIYHGSTNSTRQSHHQRGKMVDTSAMSHVLKIDTERKTALVEPNVPMDSLVEATLRHGLIPPVVTEFPGITVGGGFAGTAGESSSFRYGFFDRTINWIEMVLANGEIVIASSTERPDLFFGAASSFGTLGVTTLLEVQLIEAKTYVELTYHPVSGISEALAKLKETTSDPSIDYVDGIMYSQDSGVICSGRLTNEVKEGTRVQQFTRRGDPWFYLHAKKFIKGAKSPITEAVPLVDYLFRYDRGAFWVGYYAYKYFVTPFNRFTRWALDRLMHTRVMYHGLHVSGLYHKYIIQDVAIPYAHSAAFFSYLHASFGSYPIWLCPLKHSTAQAAHGLYNPKPTDAAAAPDDTDDRLLNFGIWGPGPSPRAAFVAWNRALEAQVRSLGGQKWLYAAAYYTRAEFDAIYDRASYDALRAKYHASYLPSVYDKVVVAAHEDDARRGVRASLVRAFWGIWPLAGVYGVFKAWRGGEYLLLREEKGKEKEKEKEKEKRK